MKVLRLFFLLLVLAPAGGALAAEPPLLAFEAGAPAATHPSLYSFADVYRLTVAGGAYGGFRFAEAQPQIRVVAESRSGEPGFSVSPPRDGSRWALVLAGLFACAWVAHRRISSPY